MRLTMISIIMKAFKLIKGVAVGDLPYLNRGAAVEAIWLPFDHESQNPVDRIYSHAQANFRLGFRGGCDLAIVHWFDRVGAKR